MHIVDKLPDPASYPNKITLFGRICRRQKDQEREPDGEEDDPLRHWEYVDDKGLMLSVSLDHFGCGPHIHDEAWTVEVSDGLTSTSMYFDDFDQMMACHREAFMDGATSMLALATAPPRRKTDSSTN